VTAREQILRARELPDVIPLFPLAGALLLPGGQLPLNIFEPRYLRMVDDALAGSRLIGMIQPREWEEASPPALYAIGCAGRITAFAETGDGRYMITLTGVRRFGLRRELKVDTPYRQAVADWARFAGDGDADESAAAVDRERLEAAMRRYLEAEGLKTDWDAVSGAPTDALIASLAMGCPFAPNEKQALLEAENVEARGRCLIALMEMTRAGEGGGGERMVQ
jgi:Lon protease-like protein